MDEFYNDYAEQPYYPQYTPEPTYYNDYVDQPSYPSGDWWSQPPTSGAVFGADEGKNLGGEGGGIDWNKILGLGASAGLGALGQFFGAKGQNPQMSTKNEGVSNQLQALTSPMLSQMMAGYQTATPPTGKATGNAAMAQSLLGMMITDPSLKNPKQDEALALLKKRSQGDPEDLRRLLSPIIGTTTRGDPQVQDITSDYASNMEKQYIDALMLANSQNKGTYMDWLGKAPGLASAQQAIPQGNELNIQAQNQYLSQMMPLLQLLQGLYTGSGTTTGETANPIMAALAALFGGAGQGIGAKVPTTEDKNKTLAQTLNLGKV
jgi:hypothetical protein